MQDLLLQLKRRIKKQTKVSFLCIGSDLRGDDAAGILVGRSLLGFVKTKRLAKRVQVVLGQTAPENFTGIIRKFGPKHLIVVDSADIDALPGEVRLLSPGQIEGVSFCTHKMPLNVLVDFLARSLDCKVIVAGIKPEVIKFGAPVTAKVRKSAQMFSAVLKELLKG